MINKENVPPSIYWRAVILTKKVSFLTREEKNYYAGALIQAMMWAKSTNRKNRHHG